MEKLIDTLMDRIGFLVLPLAIFTALLLTAIFLGTLAPSTVVADESLGEDIGGLRGREGDPLDGNESGGNPDDPDLRDTQNWYDSGSDIINRILLANRVLLVPQYNGSLLTFRIIFLADAVDVVEQGYEK